MKVYWWQRIWESTLWCPCIMQYWDISQDKSHTASMATKKIHLLLHPICNKQTNLWILSFPPFLCNNGVSRWKGYLIKYCMEWVEASCSKNAWWRTSGKDGFQCRPPISPISIFLFCGLLPLWVFQIDQKVKGRCLSPSTCMCVRGVCLSDGTMGGSIPFQSPPGLHRGRGNKSLIELSWHTHTHFVAGAPWWPLWPPCTLSLRPYILDKWVSLSLPTATVWTCTFLL